MAEKEYDVIKHELVPEHIILKEDEKKALLEKLGIRVGQLPKILTNDAVVKEIDAKEGDVIKINRTSPTAGTTTYYRVVTK